MCCRIHFFFYGTYNTWIEHTLAAMRIRAGYPLEDELQSQKMDCTTQVSLPTWFMWNCCFMRCCDVCVHLPAGPCWGLAVWSVWCFGHTFFKCFSGCAFRCLQRWHQQPPSCIMYSTWTAGYIPKYSTPWSKTFTNHKHRMPTPLHKEVQEIHLE